ncbi:MAG: metalloregulator ArsR/SmtB family transcription factor [Gaiellaceae bacterium]
MAYADALHALGDPTRRTIFERLLERPRAVHELADELPVTRPAVSQHLRVLKDAGLVTDRAAGSKRLYRVDPRGLEDLHTYVEGFWLQALSEFKVAAENEEARAKG